MLEKYPKDVKVVFKHFPLSSHKFAMKAGVAALAAEKQGEFWDFHDLLYKNYNRLNDKKIRQIAREVGLNMPAFEESMKDPKIRARVSRDKSEGVRGGVRSTPTVFVNGKLLRNRSFRGFQAAIEKEL